MKRIGLIILLTIIWCNCIESQIVVNELTSEDINDISYSVNEMAINKHSLYGQALTSILDTLSTNKYAQMYIWDIICDKDTIHTVIQNWKYSYFADNTNLSSVIGAVKYNAGTASKVFFLRCSNNPETKKFIDENFTRKCYSLSILINYIEIPSDEFIINPDISTRFISVNLGDCLISSSLIYNNKLIEINDSK